jgi:phage repressor protein C with HTH and peptisase S24 domain
MLLSQIISLAREKKSLSLRDLAALVNTSAATLSKIEKLDHVPRDPLIGRLIQVLSLEAEETWTQVARQRVAHYHMDVSVDKSDTLLSPVPIIGKVTAGAMIEAPAWDDAGYPVGSGHDAEMVPLRQDETNLYGLTVEGDSMEPVFSRGDLVFAAPNKVPKNNGFAVVKLLSGEVLLKRVIINSEMVVLQSANPSYTTLTFKANEIAYIHPITIHRLA